MKISKLLVPAVVSLFLIACSHNSPRYSPSVNNQEKLRDIVSHSPNGKLSVEPFTSSEPSRNSIVCRAAGTVQTPDGKSFEKFIEESLTSELKMSGLYSATSQKISGKLLKIDFNSNIGAGKWLIKMQFSCADSKAFIVESQYDFSTNFIADIACEQVSQALPQATQDFIEKLINTAEFKSCLPN